MKTAEELLAIIEDMKILSKKVHITHKNFTIQEGLYCDSKFKLWTSIDTINKNSPLAYASAVFFLIGKKEAIGFGVNFCAIYKINRKRKFRFVKNIDSEFLEDLIKKKPNLIYHMDVIQRLQQKMFKGK